MPITLIKSEFIMLPLKSHILNLIVMVATLNTSIKKQVFLMLIMGGGLSLLLPAGCNADGDGDINSSRNSDPVCSVGYRLVDGKCQPSPGSQGSASNRIRDRLPKEEAKPNPSESALNDDYLDRNDKGNKVWSFTIDEDVSELSSDSDMKFKIVFKSGFLVNFEYKDEDSDQIRVDNNNEPVLKLETKIAINNQGKVELAPREVVNDDGTTKSKKISYFPQTVCLWGDGDNKNQLSLANPLSLNDAGLPVKVEFTDPTKPRPCNKVYGKLSDTTDTTDTRPLSPPDPAAAFDAQLAAYETQAENLKEGNIASHILIDKCTVITNENTNENNGYAFDVTINADNNKLNIRIEDNGFNNEYEKKLLYAMLNKDKKFYKHMVNEKFVVNGGARNHFNLLETTDVVFQTLDGSNDPRYLYKEALLKKSGKKCFNIIRDEIYGTGIDKAWFSYRDYVNSDPERKRQEVRPEFKFVAKCFQGGKYDIDGNISNDKDNSDYTKDFSLTEGSLRYFLEEIDNDLANLIPQSVSKSKFKSDMRNLIKYLVNMINCQKHKVPKSIPS